MLNANTYGKVKGAKDSLSMLSRDDVYLGAELVSLSERSLEPEGLRVSVVEAYTQ